MLQSKMGSGKDFEMSPFEAARKLLSMEAQHLSLGAQSDLIFQDMDLVPLLIQENYLNHRPVIATNDQIRMQVQRSVHVAQGPLYLCMHNIHICTYTQVYTVAWVIICTIHTSEHLHKGTCVNTFRVGMLLYHSCRIYIITCEQLHTAAHTPQIYRTHIPYSCGAGNRKSSRWVFSWGHSE